MLQNAVLFERNLVGVLAERGSEHFVGWLNGKWRWFGLSFWAPSRGRPHGGAALRFGRRTGGGLGGGSGRAPAASGPGWVWGLAG